MTFDENFRLAIQKLFDEVENELSAPSLETRPVSKEPPPAEHIAKVLIDDRTALVPLAVPSIPVIEQVIEARKKSILEISPHASESSFSSDALDVHIFPIERRSLVARRIKAIGAIAIAALAIIAVGNSAYRKVKPPVSNLAIADVAARAKLKRVEEDLKKAERLNFSLRGQLAKLKAESTNLAAMKNGQESIDSHVELTHESCSKAGRDPFNLYLSFLQREVLAGRICNHVEQVDYIRKYVNKYDVPTHSICVSVWEGVLKATEKCGVARAGHATRAGG